MAIHTCPRCGEMLTADAQANGPSEIEIVMYCETRAFFATETVAAIAPEPGD